MRRTRRHPPAQHAESEGVAILNRQRTRRVDSRWLHEVIERALRELKSTAELGIHLISAREMARLNWDYLQHEGSTDVITFNHGSTRQHLHGELFISVPDAVRQAAEFGTTWRGEIARYVIHGLLHLHGYDDLTPAGRRVMKREEERLLGRIPEQSRR